MTRSTTSWLLRCARLCLLVATAKLMAEMAPANPDCVVLAGHARFSLLTDRLIRAEYSRTALFDDRQTFMILNRNLSVPHFSVTRTGNMTTITTSFIRLVYDEGVMEENAAATTVPVCNLLDNMTAFGGFNIPAAVTLSSPKECCQICANISKCTSWTYSWALCSKYGR